MQCLHALHALNDRTCRHTQRGESPTPAVTSGARTARENNTKEGKMLWCREGKRALGVEGLACGLVVARGVSPSRGGPMLQSGAEVAWRLFRRDEREIVKGTRNFSFLFF